MRATARWCAGNCEHSYGRFTKGKMIVLVLFHSLRLCARNNYLKISTDLQIQRDKDTCCLSVQVLVRLYVQGQSKVSALIRWVVGVVCYRRCSQQSGVSRVSVQLTVAGTRVCVQVKRRTLRVLVTFLQTFHLVAVLYSLNGVSHQPGTRYLTEKHDLHVLGPNPLHQGRRTCK